MLANATTILPRPMGDVNSAMRDLDVDSDKVRALLDESAQTPETQFYARRVRRVPTSPSGGFSIRLASGAVNGLLMGFNRVSFWNHVAAGNPFFTSVAKIPAIAPGSALGASLMRQRTKPGLNDLKEAIAHVLGGSLVAGKSLFSNP